MHGEDKNQGVCGNVSNGETLYLFEQVFEVRPDLLLVGNFRTQALGIQRGQTNRVTLDLSHTGRRQRDQRITVSINQKLSGTNIQNLTRDNAENIALDQVQFELLNNVRHRGSSSNRCAQSA